MTPVTPESIMRVANGFMASQYLFVANELGLFEQLEGRSATLEELAHMTRIVPGRLQILTEALVTLGFLERDQGHYRNSPVSEAFLGNHALNDFRSALRFFRLRYPLWIQLETVLRTGQAAEVHLSEEEKTIFSVGIESGTIRTAQSLAKAYDFHQHHHLLDLGGGTGSFLVTILEQYSNLKTTLFDVPEVAVVAHQCIEKTPFEGQVTIVAGDLFSASLPANHDVIMLNNVLHLFSPKNNQELLRHVRQQVSEGVRILLVDSWTDANQDGPSPISLIVGDFLLQTGEGNVYSEEQVREWLMQTNWKFIERKPLNGFASLILAEA